MSAASSWRWPTRSPRASSGDGHLIAEAGTGVGKSLAYLVPIAFAGRTVVVSTYTKALQDQLRTNDVPLAREATGMPLTAAVVKGRGNYLCRAQLETVESRIELWDVDGWQRLRPWVQNTRTGDRDEPRPRAVADAVARARGGLRALPRPALLVPRPLLRRDAPAPRRARPTWCSSTTRCTWPTSGLRAASDGAVSILPPHDLVIFDEAQMLEDVAAEWLGVRLSDASLARFARDVERASSGAQSEIPERELRSLQLHAERLFGALPAGTRTRLREPHLRALPRDAADGMRAALADVATALRGGGEESEALARHADAMAFAVEAALEPDHEETVVWSERRDRGAVELRTAPVDVAPRLDELLFSEIEGAVLVSATLALADGFSHIRRRIGLRSARELRLGSPFDVAGNARLYLPAEGPHPGGPEGVDSRWVADEIERLVDASQGRALCLFTSYRQLSAVHDLLAGRLPYRLLRQGEAPRDRLLEWFRDDVSSVLLATTSFWQGVDVPGEALSLVVIDRLPFTPPDDPHPVGAHRGRRPGRPLGVRGRPAAACGDAAEAGLRAPAALRDRPRRGGDSRPAAGHETVRPLPAGGPARRAPAVRSGRGGGVSRRQNRRTAARLNPMADSSKKKKGGQTGPVARGTQGYTVGAGKASSKPKSSGGSGGGRSPLLIGGVALAVVAVIAIGIGFISMMGGDDDGATASAAEFDAAVKTAGCTVREFPIDKGGEHIAATDPDPPSWDSDPPTHGPHDPVWAIWGQYDTEVAQRNLVHNLEHAGLVIQYGPNVPADQLAALKNGGARRTPSGPCCRRTPSSTTTSRSSSGASSPSARSSTRRCSTASAATATSRAARPSPTSSPTAATGRRKSGSRAGSSGRAPRARRVCPEEGLGHRAASGRTTNGPAGRAPRRPVRGSS